MPESEYITLEELEVEQQNKLLLALVRKLYRRYRVCFVDIAIANWERADDDYKFMDDEARLLNRLMASLIHSNNGIPPHDTEARDWFRSVMVQDDHWDT